MKHDKRDFCSECREETTYEFCKRESTHVIKDKEYCFEVYAAVCDCCGNEMGVPGIMDMNARLIQQQYFQSKSK